MAQSTRNSLITLFLSLILGAGGAFAVLLLAPEYIGFDLESEAYEATSINYDDSSYSSAWESAAPAVVSVVALKDLSDFYNQFTNGPGNAFPAQQDLSQGSNLEQVSSGTAFIVAPDGLAVTNKHVVEDDTLEYVVILNDGTELEAEVLDRDTLNDIALLQIYGDDDRIGELPALDFADSDQLIVGQPVLAIGNALGEYSNTTTAGIISATGRQILASSGYGTEAESLVDLIQTDAAINPGNSGGPLVDLEGRVVGMNTAVDTSAQGIGFAIPSNDIAMVLSSYQEFGRIVRPFLGVRYLIVNASIQKRFQLEYDYGAVLVGDGKAGLPAVQEGSSADKAGLQRGDVILSIEGVEINENYTLSNAMAAYFVGETVQLSVWREGELLSLELTLEEGA
jgi:serine protease Do